MQPRFTIHASPAASSTTTSSAVRPEGNDSVTVRSQCGRVVGRALLVEGLALGAVDEALEHDAAGRECRASAPVGDREVVADEVELGELRLFAEIRLARVGDADLAARRWREPRLSSSALTAPRLHQASWPTRSKTSSTCFASSPSSPMLDEGDPQSFRVRAYESAAQAIAAQATDLGELTAKELQKIEGIGKSTAGEDPRAPRDREGREARGAARRSTRASVVALLRDPGPRAEGGDASSAPSSASQSIDDLRKALAEHKVRGAQGLRPEVGGQARAVARAARRARVDRSHAHLGRAAARRAGSWRACCEVPGVTHASYCGSLRRFSETIGDVDVVVAARRSRAGDGGARRDDRGRAGARPRRGEDERRHPSRDADRSPRRRRRTSSARRRLYFTGLEGAQHQAAPARARAGLDAQRVRALRDRGGQASSPARPRSRSTRRSACRGSRRCCARTAARSRRPRGARCRGRSAPVIGDFHVHTSVSGDGRSSLEEVVAAAKARGYRVLAITDHAEGTLSGVGREALLEQRAKIARAASRARRLADAPARRGAEHRAERRARLRSRVPARLRLVPRLGARPLRARSRRADEARS